MDSRTIIPAKNLQLDDESKALIYGHCLLARKMGFASTPKERFQQFQRVTQNLPFCTCDGSGTKKGEHSNTYNIRSSANPVIKDVIPPKIEFIAPILKGIFESPGPTQSYYQPPSSAGSSNLRDLFKQSRQGQHFNVEGFFFSIPDFSSATFEAYYIQIDSNEERECGWFGYHTKYSIRGECVQFQYSVDTTMLLQAMGNDENAHKEIKTYLSRAIDRSAAQSQSCLQTYQRYE